jgi:serine/threonine-protein kinase HipA
VVSALTLLELDEMMARYASYEDLAHIIRRRFVHHHGALTELYGRLVFNILSGNTDDHARNHAAFWDGRRLELAPAYDICPQVRAGNVATQAMLIVGSSRMSQLKVCLDAAPLFQLSIQQGEAMIARQIAAIRDNWGAACARPNLR